MILSQHEDLVVLNAVAEKPPATCVSATCLSREKLAQICRKWGKLRDAFDSSERALYVERAELAILDTGASKTVLGKINFQRFLEQLSKHVHGRIKTAASHVTFRFGNNGTLPSLFTAFLRYGKLWFRVEVVEGSTPFCFRMLSSDR